MKKKVVRCSNCLRVIRKGEQVRTVGNSEYRIVQHVRRCLLLDAGLDKKSKRV